MKIWQVALFLIVSPMALASQELKVPTAGTYGYANNFTVALKKRFEVAYGFTDSGQARVAELRAQGYSCEVKPRQTYLCSAFLPTEGSESTIGSAVEAELSPLELKLGELRQAPALESKSETLEVWRIYQNLSFRGVDYPSYRIFLTQGLAKIFIGEPAVDGFLIDSENELRYARDFSKTESSTVFTSYFTIANFSKK